ncbi:MAG: hypothetical protein A2W27_06535 [Deltaproteobacteria bacterium RBG_16_44_11]|nr:MAG: hypothetical protein A2W27_06535 [Deltaproteobacteria bacterium RBG_16_44_11]
MIGKLKHKFVVTCFAVGMLLVSYIRVSADEIKDNKSPVDIEADSMDYDYSSDKYNAQGNVVINYSNIVLTADDVELDNKNKIATAQGNALLKMGEDTLRGDKIVFNIENKTGIAYKGQAFYARNHFYVRGDKIEKTGENTYFIEQPRATTCDGTSPDWEIAGSEMDVTIDGYGLMKNARFLTKGLPVFYSPFVPFPAKTKRQSGFLLPYLSYSRKKDGLDIEIPLFWAISPQADATFYQRYIEKRGFKEGAEFRYYLGDHSFGTWYGDFMEDRKNVIEKINFETDRDWEGMHRRWSYYLNHQTNFDSSFYARTDLRKVSDKWYFKDLSAHNYYLDHYAINEEDPFKKVPFYGNESLRSLESTARVYKGWSNYNLMGLMSYTDDFAKANNDATLQKYPEIVLTGIKQPLLATPLYYELTGTYDNYYRGEGQKGHLFDFNPAISLPINLGGYAKITPQFAFKETAWIREDNEALGDDKKSGGRTLYTASVNVSSQISRIFNFNMLNWEKIRHEIKPEVSYAYTPNVSQDNIPDYMPPITEQNAVIWALTNTLMTKVKDEKAAYTYLEFLRLKLFQAYDINEAKKNKDSVVAPKRPFSDMGIEFDLNPHKYLSFMARNKYNVYSGWKEMNYDLNIKDWRGDMFTVGYRYTIDSIEEINLNIKAMVTSKIAATYLLRRDQFHSRTVESTAGLTYYSQCWSLGVDYSQTDGDSRFLLKISLAGLGKL